jgi:hypothetical protein
MLSMKLEQLERHAANLKLLGRADEAKRRITEFMVEYVKFGRKRYASPRDISLICYHIAYKLLPELVYKSESTFEHLKSLGVPLPIYLALRGSLEQKMILDQKPLSNFTVSGGQIDSSMDYILITFPPPPFISRQAMDAAKAKLMSGHMDQIGHAIPILAPHFACATFSNEGDKAVYVLGQMEEGGSNLRMVTADGANHNLDLGLGCGIEPEAFLAKIRDHLNPPPQPELTEEETAARWYKLKELLGEEYPDCFIEFGGLNKPGTGEKTSFQDQFERLDQITFGSVLEFGTMKNFCGIEPGNFIMGSPENEVGRLDDENQRPVVISDGFWMSETPCTQGQFREVMGHLPESCQSPDSPVTCISWDHAMLFCQVLTGQARIGGLPSNWHFTLPTEAQWEYCCRAGTTTALYNGRNLTSETGIDLALDPIAIYGGNQKHAKFISKQKIPNLWGLYDMLGLVSEWCSDLYDGELIEEVAIESELIGGFRIYRGGSSGGDPWQCRSATRLFLDPTCSALGFRVILEKIE